MYIKFCDMVNIRHYLCNYLIFISVAFLCIISLFAWRTFHWFVPTVKWNLIYPTHQIRHFSFKYPSLLFLISKNVNTTGECRVIHKEWWKFYSSGRFHLINEINILSTKDFWTQNNIKKRTCSFWQSVWKSNNV